MFKKKLVSKTATKASASKAPAKTKGKVKAKAAPKGRVRVNTKAVARPSAFAKKTATAIIPKRRTSPKADLGIGPVDLEPKAGTPLGAALIAARALVDKKGQDVMVLNVSAISGLCDEMVIATARSVPHLQALADAVEEELHMSGEKALHRDGRMAAEPDWILLDYGNVMIHVFRAEARSQYRLEEYYEAGVLIARWKND